MATELYQLALSGIHLSSYWQNILHFEGGNLSAGDVIVNAQDLLDSWATNIEAAFMAMLPSTVYLNRLEARRIAAGGGIGIVTQYDPFTVPGGVSGAASSQQLCPIVRLIPPMGVKSAGKFFLPAIAESDINGNTPIAGWLTRLNTLMAAMLTDFGTGSITWQIAVYSRKLDSHSLALSYDTSEIVGFQRRRQRPF